MFKVPEGQEPSPEIQLDPKEQILQGYKKFAFSSRSKSCQRTNRRVTCGLVYIFRLLCKPVEEWMIAQQEWKQGDKARELSLRDRRGRDGDRTTVVMTWRWKVAGGSGGTILTVYTSAGREAGKSRVIPTGRVVQK